ncbi:MAG: ComF family protein [Hyphomicrobiaceae bacterium]|nr:ComF family protein [Hyphomicrobiaceae bacterium]
MNSEPVQMTSDGRIGLPTSSVAALLRKLGGWVVDVVLPPLCLACRASVQGHGGVCAACWRDIDFIESPRCDCLGIPLPYPSGDKIVSAAALADPPQYGRARAVARYDGTLRTLVHGLKYRDRHEGVELFSRWMVHAGEDLLRDADILVPVPLARMRLWERRFNQAVLLSRAIARVSGVKEAPVVLERTRRTVSQVGLSVEQRRRNVAGAFSVPEKHRRTIESMNIVLVDDVITTGATANACAKALLGAGAARVDVLALGRVVDPLTPRL